MRYRRGFFRLWMVFAVIWVGGVGIGVLSADYDNWKHNPWREQVRHEYIGCTKRSGYGCDPMWVSKETCEHDMPFDPICDSWPAAGKLLDDALVKYDQRLIYSASEHVVFMLFVPAAILAFGASLGWAVSGFKTNPRRQK